ncbi:MAG: phage holin family protein [Eubacteriales bacterium]|nr:phage holin family protein [Eubacteriales bacterium]
MENLGFTAIPAITVICYLIAQIVKATALDNKWLPVICGVAGAVLGPVAMHVMPDFAASDVITAVAIGIVSGLAATGVNQIVKQLGGGDSV